jgi:flagellar biosynthetic protein FlhB
MSEEQSQRTEPATPSRLDEARKQGQVAVSRDVQHWVALLAIWLALAGGLGALLAARVSGLATELWRAAAEPPSRLLDYQAVFVHAGSAIAAALLPLLGLTALAALASGLAQTQLLWSPQLIAPKMERISLGKGLRRFFELDRVIELAKALVQVVVASAVAWWIVAPKAPLLVAWMRSEATQSSQEMLGTLSSLMLALLGAFVPIAGIDFAWRRFRLGQRLKMTKQEVREEARQREGDPQARTRRRTRHRQLSRSRMIAAVAAADVVIANPTHFAVALRYDPIVSGAPEVLAKGRDRVALRIRAAAEANGVPVVEDKPLARVLHDSCEVGRSIPENLFQAVAEVLAYVYRLAPHRARRWRAA